MSESELRTRIALAVAKFYRSISCLENVPITDAAGTSATPSSSTSVTDFPRAQQLTAAIKLSKWLEVIPTLNSQLRHAESVPVFRAFLALSEQNQRMLIDAINRHTVTWPDVVRMFADKQFEVLFDHFQILNKYSSTSFSSSNIQIVFHIEATASLLSSSLMNGLKDLLKSISPGPFCPTNFYRPFLR